MGANARIMLRIFCILFLMREVILLFPLLQQYLVTLLYIYADFFCVFCFNGGGCGGG